MLHGTYFAVIALGSLATLSEHRQQTAAVRDAEIATANGQPVYVLRVLPMRSEIVWQCHDQDLTAFTRFPA